MGNIKQWRFPPIIQRFAIKFIKPFLVSPPIARSSATTPSQRPIVTGITPVDSLMTNGLRNRRSTSGSDSIRTDASSAAAEGTASVRVSGKLNIEIKVKKSHGCYSLFEGIFRFNYW